MSYLFQQFSTLRWICAFFFTGLVLVQPAFAQSKRTETLLRATEKTYPLRQAGVLTSYAIASSMNAKSFFADPLVAGSNLVISCTASPEPGSEVTAFRLLFVPDAALYASPEWVAAAKTVYITEPMSQYPVIMAMLEKTLDKPGDKKLKGIFLQDASGAGMGILQLSSEKDTPAVPNPAPAEKPLPPPPPQPIRQSM